MSSSSEIDKARALSELRQFLKKLLLEPGTLEKTLEIAQRHYGDHKMLDKVAEDISSETLVKISEDPKERTLADTLFLDLLKEVVEESKALY
ncbi:hypothetical protein V6U78_08550 [Marinospirillum sp. MEB164]|uniref:Uncharacterized protein n=1 Tax=Marinospirillum alkalitolerans TaxID=3123374 RepID=A0ABW8PXR0_9GAMM